MEAAAIRFLVDHAGSNLNPVLSNLLVYDDTAGRRRIQAQNGRYTVDAPTDLPPCLVNADRLLAVWNACPVAPTVKVGDDGQRLVVNAGRIRAKIALLDPGQYPRTGPTEKTPHGAAGLANALLQLLPFVATDASRPWATAICVNAHHVYATNNVIVARVTVHTLIEQSINLPGASVEAILSCGAIDSIAVDDQSATFFLEGDIWVRCQLVAGKWPTDTVDGLVDGLPDLWETANTDLRSMLDVAAKLADLRHPAVIFKDNSLCLEDDSLVASDLAPLPESGKVNARTASLVFANASDIQWHTPRRDTHAFRSGDLVGVFGGLR
jgi:hypothetical protein